MLRPVVILFLFVQAAMVNAQDSIAGKWPVRGLAIAVPQKNNLDSFVAFIHHELAPRNINVLVLFVDYNYQYTSHPELVSRNALGKEEVKKIVNACRQHGINVIPQIDLLGHQSWAGHLSQLLEVHPEFDETPWIKMPAQYTWPNDDSLYCKSYCPLHPGVHKVLFDLIDELCDVFEAKAFHAGMDEVFYIGMDKCPRCHGKDKAALFAGEVRLIHDHLAKSGRELWMWGDRLLEGRTSGLGGWEASFNGTWRAIDSIPQDVVVCDWHYERPDKTPVIFAEKGFRVITCPWNMPDVAVQQKTDLDNFKKQSTPEMSGRFYGMMQTVWSDVSRFLSGYYGSGDGTASGQKGQADTFRAVFPLQATAR